MKTIHYKLLILSWYLLFKINVKNEINDIKKQPKNFLMCKRNLQNN